MGQSEPVKDWEIIADRLHATGWSYGITEHLTKHGLLFCVDAHRDGKRFIVKADNLLTAFLSLERDTIAPKKLTRTRRAKTSPEYAHNVRHFPTVICRVWRSTNFPEVGKACLITFPDVSTHLGMAE